MDHYLLSVNAVGKADGEWMEHRKLLKKQSKSKWNIRGVNGKSAMRITNTDCGLNGLHELDSFKFSIHT